MHNKIKKSRYLGLIDLWLNFVLEIMIQKSFVHIYVPKLKQYIYLFLKSTFVIDKTSLEFNLVTAQFQVLY